MFCPKDGNELRITSAPSGLGTVQYQNCEACGTMWRVALTEGAYNPERELVTLEEDE